MPSPCEPSLTCCCQELWGSEGFCRMVPGARRFVYLEVRVTCLVLGMPMWSFSEAVADIYSQHPGLCRWQCSVFHVAASVRLRSWMLVSWPWQRPASVCGPVLFVCLFV